MDETTDTLGKLSCTIIAVVMTKDVTTNDREAKWRDAVNWGCLAKRISEWSPHGPYDLGDQACITNLAVLSQFIGLKKCVKDAVDDAVLGQFRVASGWKRNSSIRSMESLHVSMAWVERSSKGREKRK